jgi:hypothetical protein
MAQVGRIERPTEDSDLHVRNQRLRRPPR